MSLTVLQIVQQALWPIAGARPPSLSITSTTLAQEIQLRSVLYDVSRELRRELRSVTQKKTHTFELQSGVDSYQLPKDFFAAIHDTQYDTDQQWQLDGPLSDANFQAKVYQQAGATVTAYRIFGPDNNPASAGGQFKVYPTPTSTGTELAFDYITANLFMPPFWASGQNITSGDYRSANGNIYQATTTATTTGSTAPSHTDPDTPTASGGVTWDYIDDAYETIVTSSDLSLFDDELMILGVRVHYMESKRKSPGRWAAEYQAAKKAAKSRFNGSFSGSFGSQACGPKYSVPDGGWSF